MAQRKNWSFEDIVKLALDMTDNKNQSITSALDNIFSQQDRKSAFNNVTDDVTKTGSNEQMAHASGSRFVKNNVEFFTCPNPSCKKKVLGSVSYELEPDEAQPDDNGQTVTFTGKVTGVNIKHDCTPRITR